MAAYGRGPNRHCGGADQDADTHGNVWPFDDTDRDEDQDGDSHDHAAIHRHPDQDMDAATLADGDFSAGLGDADRGTFSNTDGYRAPYTVSHAATDADAIADAYGNCDGGSDADDADDYGHHR